MSDNNYKEYSTDEENYKARFRSPRLINLFYSEEAYKRSGKEIDTSSARYPPILISGLKGSCVIFRLTSLKDPENMRNLELWPQDEAGRKSGLRFIRGLTEGYGDLVPNDALLYGKDSPYYRGEPPA